MVIGKWRGEDVLQGPPPEGYVGNRQLAEMLGLSKATMDNLYYFRRRCGIHGAMYTDGKTRVARRFYSPEEAERARRRRREKAELPWDTRVIAFNPNVRGGFQYHFPNVYQFRHFLKKWHGTTLSVSQIRRMMLDGTERCGWYAEEAL